MAQLLLMIFVLGLTFVPWWVVKDILHEITIFLNHCRCIYL